MELIFQNFEEVLGNTNNLNRKLEEVHGVGKEFTTVAELWGKFSDLISTQQVRYLIPYNAYIVEHGPDG